MSGGRFQGSPPARRIARRVARWIALAARSRLSARHARARMMRAQSEGSSGKEGSVDVRPPSMSAQKGDGVATPSAEPSATSLAPDAIGEAGGTHNVAATTQSGSNGARLRPHRGVAEPGRPCSVALSARQHASSSNPRHAARRSGAPFPRTPSIAAARLAAAPAHPWGHRSAARLQRACTQSSLRTSAALQRGAAGSTFLPRPVERGIGAEQPRAGHRGSRAEATREVNWPSARRKFSSAGGDGSRLMGRVELEVLDTWSQGTAL